MRLRSMTLLSRIGIIPGQPQLRAAQLEAIGRKIPLLYLIMAVDALSLARHAYGSAPRWLGVDFPALFVSACLARGVFWVLESRRPVPKPDAVTKRFRFSMVLGGFVLAVFVGWAIAVFDDATAAQRPSLVFDALGMALTCTLCLKHYPAAAVLVLGVVVVPFVAVTLASGDPTLASIAVTSIFVSVIVLYILIADFENFRLMVESREALRERHAQVEKLHSDAKEAEERRLRERREMLGELAGAFRRSVEEVTHALGGVARRSGSQADELARHSTAALQLLGETTSSAKAADESSQLVASSAASLCASIASIRERVGTAVEIANTVESRTDAADRAMNKLGERLGQIDTIAQLIKGIADQIDLIALNATIEAARAGETGRAFAVVAAEIKHLAQQTARATIDIRRRTGEVNAASVEASGSVSATREAFLELLAVSMDLAAALNEQTELTRGIGESVDRSVRSSKEMRSRLDDLSASALQTNQSAQSLLGQCGALGDKSETLTREVGKFVGVLRAA